MKIMEPIPTPQVFSIGIEQIQADKYNLPAALDVGGILVTLYRIMTDIKFIHQIKREFIMESFNEMIRGKEYSFAQST
jgi:hypothetical protein